MVPGPGIGRWSRSTRPSDGFLPDGHQPSDAVQSLDCRQMVKFRFTAQMGPDSFCEDLHDEG